MGVYDINYIVISDLRMTRHYIYEENMKSCFMGMKHDQLVSNVLESV
jgi:hypothetical protein